LAKLAGDCAFFTALGADADGEQAARELTAAGLELHSATRERPTRRGFSFLSADHERTITVIGERVVAHGADRLPWDVLDGCDAAYFTGGDVEALRHARRARWLVATPRALDTLREARVEIDVLVSSATDPGEQVADGALDPPPRFVVRTHGHEGGEWVGHEGRTGRWVAHELPGEPVDAYGCGDSFAGGLTFGLGDSDDIDVALKTAAECGAHALCGRGPYAGQLTRRSAA
ncbi:MAG: PfkB domain protein, partial [Solirubrobacteraceae bacterium]|nr:PfkB domain protein [Solirubrobacteraceae bacterium]